MPLNLSINNIAELKAEIEAYPKDIEKIINNEFKAFGENLRDDAVRMAPVNEGALRESINYLQNDLRVSVGAYIDYASYLEFGTKKFAEAYVATLPEDWQAFAAEHKGGDGGTFADLIRAIMKWVQLKGIAETLTESGYASKSKSAIENQEQVAYLIARKIVRDGIKEHPYLYPAFEKNKLELIAKLKEKLNVK